MKHWTNVSLMAVLSGLSVGIAYAQTPLTPEQLFYDGFESGSLSAWPFTSVATSSAGVGTLAPAIVGPSTGMGDSNVVFAGTKSAKMIGRTAVTANSADATTMPRISHGALFTRAMNNQETLLATAYIWDVYNQPGYVTSAAGNTQTAINQRFWIEYRGSTTSASPFAASFVQQISQGIFNGATNATVNPGLQVNGSFFGVNTNTATSISSVYAGRIVSVAFGNGSGFASASNITATGNTAPGWTYHGFPGTQFARSSGWKKFSLSYNMGEFSSAASISVPGVARLYVDSKLGFFWNVSSNGNDARKIDSVVLNPSLTPSVDAWVDEVLVRSFPRGSVNLLPKLGDVLAGADVTTVPITVTLTPASGNSNPGATWTQNMNSLGEINTQLPANVRGDYSMTLDGGSWLKKTAAINISDHGTFEVVINLQNGDVDGSGEVDAADIDSVIANFGGSGGPTQGDVDLSGEVDAADIDVVIANFGGFDN